MWKDLEKESLEELLFVLNNIIARSDGLEQMDPTQILDVAKGSDGKIEKEIKAFAAKIFKIPEFLLDTSYTKPALEVLAALQKWRKQILDHIELQEHPDSLPELLYGQREFGCVYVPTELLKRLHLLGETVLEYMKTKDRGTSKKTEGQMLEVMIEASEWVKYTKRKWGIIPGAELAVVSPLTKEEIENAKPDVETDPPF